MHGVSQDHRSPGQPRDRQDPRPLATRPTDPVGPDLQASRVHLLPAQGARARRARVRDLPRTDRAYATGRGTHGTVARERSAEPRRPQAPAASAHDGLVRRLPQTREYPARRQGTARLRDLPPLTGSPRHILTGFRLWARAARPPQLADARSGKKLGEAVPESIIFAIWTISSSSTTNGTSGPSSRGSFLKTPSRSMEPAPARMGSRWPTRWIRTWCSSTCGSRTWTAWTCSARSRAATPMSR